MTPNEYKMILTLRHGPLTSDQIIERFGARSSMLVALKSLLDYGFVTRRFTGDRGLVIYWLTDDGKEKAKGMSRRLLNDLEYKKLMQDVATDKEMEEGNAP